MRELTAHYIHYILYFFWFILRYFLHDISDQIIIFDLTLVSYFRKKNKIYISQTVI